MALNDSDKADFGLSNTDKLESVCFTPTIPINGRSVKLEISSIFWIEFVIKNIKNTTTRGIMIPKKKAST